MKLEELLGAELYAQVQAKLDEVNGKETDKQKHVRYADLSEGEYVNKSKHAELQSRGFRGYSITDNRVCYYENKPFYRQ